MVSASAAEAPPATTAPALTAEQKEQIDAAAEPAELIALAKQFVMLRQTPAARACIDKAVNKNPALLADPKPQTPSSWHDVWFTHRAELRERKLKPDDAAGRVEIAQWLQQAGIRKPAQAMLLKALEIDPQQPDAVRLADEWHLTGGGPFQFDLGYGYSQPLIVDTVSDEGEPLAATRPDRNTFLLLPFSYEARGEKLVINKTSIKASADNGRSCRIVGILLLVSDPRGGGEAGPRAIARADRLQLQESNEPLWEQLEIERGPDGETVLVCQNLTRPASKRPGAQPAQPQPRRSPAPRSGGGSGRGGEYGSGLPAWRSGLPSAPALAGRALAAWLQINRIRIPNAPRGEEAPEGPGRRPTPNAPPPNDPNSRKQTRPASGYAVFAVEIPNDAKQLTAVYRDEMQTTLDVPWLATLDQAAQSLQGKERADYVAGLLERIQSSDVFTAAAAAGKLGQVREAIQAGGAPDAALVDPKAVRPAAGESEQIIAALMQAVASDKPPLKRQALNALVLTAAPVPAPLLAAAADGKQTAVAETALAEIERHLPRGPKSDARTPTDIGSQGTPQEIAVAELQPADAPANLFAVLAATLRNPQPEIARRAVGIVLAGAAREGVAALADVPGPTRALVAELLAGVTDETLRAAVLRVQLIRPDANTLPALLKTCEGSVLAVRSENDPLLVAFKGGLPAESAIGLLALVAKADLSGLSNASALDKLLERVERDARGSKPLRAALLQLALTQFRGIYEAPLPSDLGGNTEFGESGGGPDSLLARLATAPGTDPDTALTAAAALIGAGRITALGRQVDQMQSDSQRNALIRGLAENKNLWKREALVAFLAARLKEENRKFAMAAINALAAIYKATEPAERWRFNLAVKIGLDLQELLKLTAGSDERLTVAAMGLLRQIGQFTTTEAEQIQNANDPNARQEAINQINQQRLEKSPGRLACIIYLDLEPIQQQGNNPSAGPGTQPRSLRLVPLPGPEVGIEKGATPGGFEVLLGTQSIRDTVDESPAGDVHQGIPLDVSLLLKEAIHTADPAAYPFVTTVDQFALNEKLPGSLKYRGMGTWFCDANLSGQTGNTSPDSTLRINRVRMVLEPKTK